MTTDYSYLRKPTSCDVCGESATKSVGYDGILPVCDCEVCFVTRMEEVNKILRTMKYPELEVEHVPHN